MSEGVDSSNGASLSGFEGTFVGYVDHSIAQHKRLADRAMCFFIALRLGPVAASAILPALTTVENRIYATVAAVVVAFLTGLDTQFRWGEEWRHFARPNSRSKA